jgi:acyl dehydratase
MKPQSQREAQPSRRRSVSTSVGLSTTRGLDHVRSAVATITPDALVRHAPVSRSRERPRLNPGVAGRAYPTTTYEVTAEAIEAYARATNTSNERYRAGADSVAGPVWPVVPAFGFFMAAVRDPDLGADLRRLLHLGEEHVLHGPIRPGDVLVVDGILEAVDEQAGTFTVAVAETDRAGRLLAEVRATMLVRGAGSAGPQSKDAGSAGPQSKDAGSTGPQSKGAGTPNREAPATEPVHESTVEIDADQMQRYAEASGDHNPIHLDPSAARHSGLRSPIVHGMCTMAMATAGAVDGLAGGDPSAVGRVGVSFARPVLPGQRLTTRFWPGADDGARRRFAFATFNEDDAAVLTDAEVDLGT